MAALLHNKWPLLGELPLHFCLVCPDITNSQDVPASKPEIKIRDPSAEKTSRGKTCRMPSSLDSVLALHSL